MQTLNLFRSLGATMERLAAKIGMTRKIVLENYYNIGHLKLTSGVGC